jgi:hypothetical protein
MQKPILTLFLLGMLIAGCAAVKDMQRLDRFNEIASDYKLAMRWSDFETVNSYRKDRKADDSFGKIEKLQDKIQVISYDVRDLSVSEDSSEVRQVVEIHYYRLDRLTEKMLKAIEVWEYVEPPGKWVLKGDLPEFK